MKYCFWLVLLFSSSLLNAYTSPPPFGAGMEIEDIAGALKAGNASQLSHYFDIRVDITLPDKSDNYSRTQAERIMRDFFSNNDVRNFDINYRGDNNGSKYCIGILKTRNGDYRTKLFLKQKDSRQVLQEIAFQSVD